MGFGVNDNGRQPTAATFHNARFIALIGENAACLPVNGARSPFAIPIRARIRIASALTDSTDDHQDQPEEANEPNGKRERSLDSYACACFVRCAPCPTGSTEQCQAEKR